MSEEILKALMQLFAIIAKQDQDEDSQEQCINERNFVEEFLKSQLNEELVEEYIALYDDFYKGGDTENKKKRLTSVSDSVKTLGICKKINKTLAQKQKVIVLLRLFELVHSDRKFSPQRMAIIDTVAEVFNISMDEFNSIKRFIIEDGDSLLDVANILLINTDDNEDKYNVCKHIKTGQLDKSFYILHVKSVDVYFCGYPGRSEVYLNGLLMNPKRIYIFAPGSTIKLPSSTVYYSDVVSRFLSATNPFKINFKAEYIDYKFSEGNYGLRDISIQEEEGKLIGIMGASGAGKTTLLNVLSGIETPSFGKVLINGINLHADKKELKGIIGYIPQDDLLIEELTVYDNLYYNTKLCFKDLTEEEIGNKVDIVLKNLGLLETKHLKVGSPLNKKISGGQRKRLNIALELIREPLVLFVDEPTSGLSSKDSENVMDLLRELSLKGKLIFVVIHQPSSDIYKLFDKIIFLDVGGYLIYYGNPIEAITYFKKQDQQVNWEQGECPICGTVNPELVFNIVEAKVVDEFGNLTPNRKVSPKNWQSLYQKYFNWENAKKLKENIKDKLPSALNIPSWFNQLKIFTIRDLLSKVSNTQYLIINLLETPLLAFILSFIIRYVPGHEDGEYIFRENENLPPFIFMAIIVALFVGLTVSAEEIFRDRKILKRERFLNLSRSSYLMSKISILFVLSAIQMLFFVLISNSIFGVKEMYWDYWLVLFSVSCFANMLGLNISASFNSAVTIYILIPLVMIPQMILGGAMFSFDKLNQYIGGGYKVPLIADVMSCRWAYEALVVNQYVNNKYQKNFYVFDKNESVSDFKQAILLPELKKITENTFPLISNDDDSSKNVLAKQLTLLKNEVAKETKSIKSIKFDYTENLNLQNYNEDIAVQLITYFEELQAFYTLVFNEVSKEKNAMIDIMQSTPEKRQIFTYFKNSYYNESLEDVAKRAVEKNHFVITDNEIIQLKDPVFLDPKPNHLFDYRSHFYAPIKYFMGKKYSTYGFNIVVIWIMIIFLYVTLYFDALSKFLNLVGSIQFNVDDKVQAIGNNINFKQKLKANVENFQRSLKLRKLKKEKNKK